MTGTAFWVGGEQALSSERLLASHAREEVKLNGSMGEEERASGFRPYSLSE